jgi:hypothetical protein
LDKDYAKLPHTNKDCISSLNLVEGCGGLVLGFGAVSFCCDLKQSKQRVLVIRWILLIAQQTYCTDMLYSSLLV